MIYCRKSIAKGATKLKSTSQDMVWQKLDQAYFGLPQSIHSWVTGHNGHKPKRPQPKRPQTEMAKNRNGHKPKRPQAETATDRNGHRPKRPQTGRATNQSGHRPERLQTETATSVVTHHISCHPQRVDASPI